MSASEWREVSRQVSFVDEMPFFANDYKGSDSLFNQFMLLLIMILEYIFTKAGGNELMHGVFFQNEYACLEVLTPKTLRTLFKNKSSVLSLYFYKGKKEGLSC